MGPRKFFAKGLSDEFRLSGIRASRAVRPRYNELLSPAHELHDLEVVPFRECSGIPLRAG